MGSYQSHIYDFLDVHHLQELSGTSHLHLCGLGLLLMRGVVLVAQIADP